MKAIDIPGLGKGVVLPPAEPEASHLFAVDTVHVDQECQRRAYHKYTVICPTCDGSGAISVPYVVRRVIPFIDGATVEMFDVIAAKATALAVIAGRCLLILDGQITSTFDLPDAQPGGVLLLVERKPQ